ncbi:MAG: hypothetical protein A3C53_04555 [Omnitrophica WOR_2 bacterium RIFCSPHIGHO2_02_FULL_68_15]|nr:MAG: hypothetical protein A3C53_04555 [Omnitrophica WOR_2 bacterium RIFCSPHIGHO2_02_FULL_68_15]
MRPRHSWIAGLWLAVTVPLGAGTAASDPEWIRQPFWTPGAGMTASVRIDTAEGFRAFTTGGVVRDGHPARWDGLGAFQIVLPWTSRDPVTVSLKLRTPTPLQRFSAIRVVVNGAPFMVTPLPPPDWVWVTIPLTPDHLRNPTPIPYYNNDKLVNHITLTMEETRWPRAARRLVRSLGMPSPAPSADHPDAHAERVIEIQSITITPHQVFARLGHETRRGVVATTPAQWDTSMTMPPDGARVSFGYGVPEEWQTLSSAPVRFAVSVNAKEIWTDTVTPDRVSPIPWRDADLDLSRYAGRDTVLRFSASAAGGTAYGFWSLPAVYRPAQWTAAQHPNVVLVTIDALRADRFSRDGYPRPTSPTIDALIAQGVYCPNTIAHSSWTLPSTASIVTGLAPMRHGALRDDQRLPDALVTLPEWFRQAGYATAVIQANQFLHEQYGFCQGVDRYYFDPGASPEHPIRADAQMAYAARWISQLRRQPFFLWLHLMEVHAPYGGYFPPATITRFGQTDNDKYDAAIRMLDERLDTLRQILRDQQLSARTLLVVTSDHGEEFGDHGGTGHGHTLYQELIRVPLILHWPGRLPAGTVVTPMVRHIDLFPTIAELVGLPAPSVDGQSLVPLIRHPDTAHPQPAFSWICSADLKGYVFMSLLTPDGWKYIRNANAQVGALYNLTQDPREQRDLSAQNPSKADEMQRLLLAAWQTKADAEAPPVALSSSTKEHLRSLGYFQ